jgi:hypothetical protein
MRGGILNAALILSALVAIPRTSYSQYGALPSRSKSAEAGKANTSPSAAPIHDLSGVWIMRNPPGSNRGFTLYTFTDPKTDPPTLTPWGEEKFKEAQQQLLFHTILQIAPRLDKTKIMQEIQRSGRNFVCLVPKGDLKVASR